MSEPDKEQTPYLSGHSDGQRSNRPSRVTSSYIEEIVLRTLESLPTDEAKRNYAKAMMMAVNLGDMREASPCHPEQIYKECRFNASAQREYKIVLSKDDAVDFLKSFCATDISETGFKRTHTRATYEQKFSRISWKAGRRSMLCTYAEWLYMHDYLFEPRLPKQLVDLVPDGWKPPIGKGEQINE